MSESYTTGGDKTISIPRSHWAGQTFRPVQDHDLEYIDLMLRLWGLFPEPFVGVYYAGSNHEPGSEYLSRNKYWLINYALSPKDWLWYEPWGKTLRENHYWLPQPVLTPPLFNITNSRITIENTGQTAQWLDTLLSTTPFPLVDDDGKHLYFHHHSPLSSGHPQHHWNSYTFITKKALETWYLEAIISHGTDWAPFNSGYRPTPLGAAFFEGQGPSIFDFTQHWINARIALALDPDPTGWALSHHQLRLEDTAANPGGKLTNAYLGIANQQHQPPPQDDYPIGKGGYSWPGKIYRVRFPMTPITLEKDSYYAILVTSSPSIFDIAPSWQYDNDDATYPRGIRIFSDDSKDTWTKHYNDDHLFAEFGKPPLPKPEPPPPIEHFAPLDIQYKHYTTAITITLTTGVPCHLTCYYTDKTPLKHPISRVVRGITVPWSTHFCFVAWKAAEQAEPGDTLYHTFEIPDWTYCETKWFTFRGNISNELSPSIGPTFKHHHSVLVPWRHQHYILPGTDYMPIYAQIIRGQSFTPQEEHILHSIKVLGYRAGSPGGVGTVKVYRCDPSTHLPVGPPIATGFFDPMSWHTSPLWNEIILVGKPVLEVDTEYCFSIINEGTPLWQDSIRIRWDRAGTYARGILLQGYSGVLDTAFPLYDCLFEEWGYIIPKE
ncbi:hypothetical protein ES703_42145 [subsurface metagenome]